MLNLKQTDCRMGGVAFAAGEDLSLKAGHLVKLNSGGDLVLPVSDRELPMYVVVQGADQGYLCGAVPLTSAMNCRVKLAGACACGELLVSNGDGRVKAFSQGSAARLVGVAEELGVEGQHVLVRPLPYGVPGPAGADGAPGPAGADGAPGAPGSAGAAGRDGGVLTVSYASIGGSKPAIADSPGLMLWLSDNSGFGWTTTWTSEIVGKVFYEGVVVGVDVAAGTVSVMLLSATDLSGTTTAQGDYPRSIPAGLVKVGTPSVSGLLGAMSYGETGYFCLGVGSEAFEISGNAWLKMMIFDSNFVMCGWGAALEFA